MARKCPGCGAEAEGKFCSQCGSVLAAQTCGACGNEIPEGGRFCNMCGVPVAAGRKRAAEGGSARKVGAGVLPWAIGAAALAAIAVAIIGPGLGDEEPAQTPPFAAAPGPGAQAGGAAPVGDPSAIDLSSMTPEEQAGRLFDRVVRLAESGDSTQARAFVPMALAAYQRLPEADIDSRYHVATLLLVADEPAVALTTANTILTQVPNHLLALFVAAEAERRQGNEAEAEALYRQFLDSYDSEVATARSEYADHANALPDMRSQAQQYIDG